MLVLQREEDEKILVGEDITIVVVKIRGGSVRLGIEAPDGVNIWREEVFNAKLKKFYEDNHKKKQ